MEAVFERMTELDDPNDRCEGTSQSYGACPFKKVNGTKYCPRHGGTVATTAANRDAHRNYRLMRWKSRVNEFADSDAVKSLREEIGILRMILEEMINQCTESVDLLLYSHKMSDLVMRIEKLVTSCDRLENRMGLLLNKGSVLHIAQQYIQIISENIADPSIIEKISSQMLEVTMSAENPLPANEFSKSLNGTG